MKVTDLKYTRRFNLGDFEHEEFSISVCPEESEDHVRVLLALKFDVTTAHEGNVEEIEEAPPSIDEAGQGPVETLEEKPSKGKGKKSKPEPTTTHSEETETTEEDEADIDETEDEAEETEDATEEETEEEEVEEEKPAKPAKKLRKKNEVYDRDSQVHRTIFTKLIGGLVPNWKKSEDMKAKVKKASVALEGSEYLDADGEVLESFKVALKKKGVKA